MRDELLAHLDHPKTRDFYRLLGRNYGWVNGGPAPDEVSDAFLDAERSILRLGELFYVSADMTDVAEAAGKTLPNFGLNREDLPAERGLLMFDRPIAEWVDGDGRVSHVIACSWTPGIPRLFPPDYLVLNFYTWRDLNLRGGLQSGLITDEGRSLIESQPRLIHDNESGFRLGQEHEMPPATTLLGSWGRTVLSAWLLMQQPGVSTREPYKYGQHDLKWLKRRRLRQSPVTVVRLRYATSGGSGASHAGREYHHRWMVRGHWRRQWYPSRGSHVPIWISPHIKGPDDAPIKAGERVNAWVR